MKLAWLTDIHLNFLDANERSVFYSEVVSNNPDRVLISGDIAEAPCLIALLNEMLSAIKMPIYFVLGNHDYYKSRIHDLREAIIETTKSNRQLFWLPAAGIQQLSDHTILLGQDGWADGRLGDYVNSRVSINDSRMIADLFQEKIVGKFQLLDKMQQLADIDAVQLKGNLIEAIQKSPKRIIVLTHVPPFREACTHAGKVSDDQWLPYFSSKVMGDVLTEIASENPSIEFLVLCGHTHGEANYQALENLTVKAGKAEYYRPEVQEIITI